MSILRVVCTGCNAGLKSGKPDGFIEGEPVNCPKCGQWFPAAAPPPKAPARDELDFFSETDDTPPVLPAPRTVRPAATPRSGNAPIKPAVVKPAVVKAAVVKPAVVKAGRADDEDDDRPRKKKRSREDDDDEDDDDRPRKKKKKKKKDDGAGVAVYWALRAGLLIGLLAIAWFLYGMLQEKWKKDKEAEEHNERVRNKKVEDDDTSRPITPDDLKKPKAKKK